MSKSLELTQSEQAVIKRFRQFLMQPGQMLCFDGPELEKHGAALRKLASMDLLEEEQFRGAYSLTTAGFQAMKSLQKQS